MGNYTDHLHSVHQARARLQQQIEAIRKDPTLSEVGKAQQIRQIADATNQQIAQLKQQYQTDRSARKDQLAARLFGPSYRSVSPTEAERLAMQQSYRDALARADALTSHDEAVRAYLRAQRSGDREMMRAIFTLAATERGWQGVVNQHLQGHEADREAYNELVGLEHADASAAARFEMRMAFGVAEPPEPQQQRAALAKLDAEMARQQQQQAQNTPGAYVRPDLSDLGGSGASSGGNGTGGAA